MTALARLGYSADEAVFIGDSVHDIEAGDAASDKALSLASKTEAQGIKPQLAQARKQGIKLQEAQEKAKKQAGENATKPGSNPLQNPFGVPGTTP